MGCLGETGILRASQGAHSALHTRHSALERLALAYASGSSWHLRPPEKIEAKSALQPHFGACFRRFINRVEDALEREGFFRLDEGFGFALQDINKVRHAVGVNERGK